MFRIRFEGVGGIGGGVEFGFSDRDAGGGCLCAITGGSFEKISCKTVTQLRIFDFCDTCQLYFFEAKRHNRLPPKSLAILPNKDDTLCPEDLHAAQL